MKTEANHIVVSHLLRCGLALLILTCAVNGALQDGGDKPSKDKDTKAASEEQDDRITAIVNGDVHTVTNGVMRRATVLIEGDKIKAVGTDVEVPEDAEIIDASGMVVTPGFISMRMSRVGISSRSGSREKPEDLLDPFDSDVKLALAVGITTGCLQVSGRRSSFRRRSEDGLYPGLDPDVPSIVESFDNHNPDFGDPNTALCPCCGLPILPTEPITEPKPQPIAPQKDVVIKMSAGELDGMLLSSEAFFNVTSGALQGATNKKQWRETIQKAREYLKAAEAHKKKTAAGEKDRPPRKPVSDEVLRLVQREIPLRISADSVTSIREMIELAEELEYDLVIDSAIEGWVIPDELARAGISVVITPRRRRQPELAREDVSGSSIELSGTLEQSGVPFAVAPLSSSISLNGLAGRDLTSLPLEAAFAVRGGCSNTTALEALTIVPARMLKLQDRIGSIEPGKDADLLILNGQPLDYRTYVETALVNGSVVYVRSKDRVLPVYYDR